LTRGSIEHEGQVYPAHTAFELDVSDGAVTITGHEDTEFLRVQLPHVQTAQTH
jgi:hypothetical protein